jgi:hypothetical protein
MDRDRLASHLLTRTCRLEREIDRSAAPVAPIELRLLIEPAFALDASLAVLSADTLRFNESGKNQA